MYRIYKKKEKKTCYCNNLKYPKHRRSSPLNIHRKRRSARSGYPRINDIALAVAAIKGSKPRYAKSYKPVSTGRKYLKNIKNRYGIDLYSSERALQRHGRTMLSATNRAAGRALYGYAYRQVSRYLRR